MRAQRIHLRTVADQQYTIDAEESGCMWLSVGSIYTDIWHPILTYTPIAEGRPLMIQYLSKTEDRERTLHTSPVTSIKMSEVEYDAESRML